MDTERSRKFGFAFAPMLIGVTCLICFASIILAVFTRDHTVELILIFGAICIAIVFGILVLLGRVWTLKVQPKITESALFTRWVTYATFGFAMPVTGLFMINPIYKATAAILCVLVIGSGLMIHESHKNSERQLQAAQKAEQREIELKKEIIRIREEMAAKEETRRAMNALRTYHCNCEHLRGIWPAALLFNMTYEIRASDMHEAFYEAERKNEAKWGSNHNGCSPCVRRD